MASFKKGGHDRRSSFANYYGCIDRASRLLYEINSFVDKETDKKMQAIIGIKQEFAHYTVITVSHRRDVVVQDFDHVSFTE